MKHPLRPRLSLPLVLLSVVLGCGTARLFFDQPNAVNGGTMMMVCCGLFTLPWLILLDRLVTSWKRRKDSE